GWTRGFPPGIRLRRGVRASLVRRHRPSWNVLCTRPAREQRVLPVRGGVEDVSGDARAVPSVSQVRPWEHAAVVRLREGWSADHVQGVGLFEPGLRIQYPYRQRGDQL